MKMKIIATISNLNCLFRCIKQFPFIFSLNMDIIFRTKNTKLTDVRFSSVCSLFCTHKQLLFAAVTAFEQNVSVDSGT